MFTVSHFPMHNNRSSFKGKTFCNTHQFNITWHPSTLHQDYELKPEEKKCTITGFNSSVCWLSDYQRIADYVNITVNKSEYFQSYFSATDDASNHNDNFLLFSKELYYLSTYI